MHHSVINLVVDIIRCTQVRFAALVLRVAGYLYAHSPEIHLCGIEVSCRAYLGRTDMQAVRSDQVVMQLHVGIAVDCVGGYPELVESEHESADVQSSRVIDIRSYVHQGFCGQVLSPNVQV